VSGVVLTVLLAGACTDKGEPLGPTATLAQPTTTADPFAIPPVIDEAYVNRVLAGLDHALGEATRIVVRENAISQDVVSRLEELYIDELCDCASPRSKRTCEAGFRRTAPT
jgi:hypothetical protein